MTEAQAKTAVVAAGRKLVASGLVARTWGNVSCRIDDTTFAITPSGMSYDMMTEDDVVICRMPMGEYSGSRKPSSEKGVHIASYIRFPDAGFVIHTHQTYASALGVASFSKWLRSNADEEALGGVALADYGLPGTKKLQGEVEAAQKSGAHTVLMAHHGALIAGRDAEEAFARAALLELLCEKACKWQPGDAPTDSTELAALAAKVEASIGNASYTAHPAVVTASTLGVPLRARLDDMAQLIGPSLISVSPDTGSVIKALKNSDAVLVKGLGAICHAESEGDRTALKLLTEKACIVEMHAQKCNSTARLSTAEAMLMRFVYKKKYSKKIGG